MIQTQFFHILCIALSGLLLQELRKILFRDLELLRRHRRIDLRILEILCQPVQNILLKRIIVAMLQELHMIADLHTAVLQPAQHLAGSQFRVITAQIGDIRTAYPFRRVQQNAACRVKILLEVFRVQIIHREQFTQKRNSFFRASGKQILPKPRCIGCIDRGTALRTAVPQIADLLCRIRIGCHIAGLPVNV